jgi:hypothetical protein
MLIPSKIKLNKIREDSYDGDATGEASTNARSTEAGKEIEQTEYFLLCMPSAMATKCTSA